MKLLRFGPVGHERPGVLAADGMIRDLGGILCKVNGEIRQNGATADMVFPVDALIAYVSLFMTLHPGDVITTGTPAGVGWGRKPLPVYLRPGDVVEMGVEGLGEQRLELL